MKSMRLVSLAAMAFASVALPAAARAEDPDCPGIKEEYCQGEVKELLAPDFTQGPGLGGGAISGPGGYVLGFEGLSQYYTASVGRNFIPPDSMGAIGKTQYLQTINGAVGVFDKSGGLVSAQSDVAFWAAAGQTGANGDTRVLYNKAADRWIAVAFGSNVKDLQIAVSDTSNAAGTWKSTKFEGYAGFGFGSTADYPTLAMDGSAIYIGTNNFAPKTNGGSNSFRGTTLNVIPLTDLFNAGAPTTANKVSFETAYTGTAGDDVSRGFAIQGVNKDSAGDGHIAAVSLTNFGVTRYNILNPGTAGATRTAADDAIYANPYDGNGPGRQPGGFDGNPSRVIDTLDDRVGSSVFEVNNKIYLLHTVTPTGTDHTAVRLVVLDATTNAILDERDIADADHDYYEGSLSVNSEGDVVVGFNRSGSGADGKISFLARVYQTTIAGLLYQASNDILLRVSDTDQYENGGLFGQPPAGRQRWGDYSSVTLDPTDSRSFWLIGEYAKEYNLPQFGHPGGTGGSRYGEWIANIDVSSYVPEPATWAMMVTGFGFVGFGLRRSRKTSVSYA